MVQVLIIRLELALLKQDDLSRLGDFDAYTVQALGFTDQLQDLGVELDVQGLVLWVSNDERGLEPCLGLVNGVDSNMVPKVFEGHQGPRHLVVRYNNSLVASFEASSSDRVLSNFQIGPSITVGGRATT